MANYKNIMDFELAAKNRLDPFQFNYLKGGADDNRTATANETAYQKYILRPRVLVDVRQVNTQVPLFGKNWHSPIALSPVGTQCNFHPEGEVATARAAHQRQHLMMASTVSSKSYREICASTPTPPWFQLYTSGNLEQTKRLISTAEELGCPVIVLTVDVPVLGNRESSKGYMEGTMRQNSELGNFRGESSPAFDASLTWEFIHWLREQCSMRVVLKGILTAEDAALALQYGADGIIVSNHGGRQLESGCSTIEALPEITAVVQKRIPVLLDGGIRRGTDILKAIALGADKVCIGRAFCYGLAAEGQKGVEMVLEMLHEELVRNMQLTGVTQLYGTDLSNYVR